jgi:hypothetical protein
MHRNGKMSQGAGDTLIGMGTPLDQPRSLAAATGSSPQVLGTAPEMVGAAPSAPGSSSQVLGTAPEVVVAAPSASGSSSQRSATAPRPRMAVFGTNASIAQRLVAAQIAIDAVLADRDLQAVLAAYGYDAGRMAEGKARYDQALALQQQQRAHYGDMYAATDARAAAQTQAHSTTMRHIGVARVALRGDRGARQKLGLAAPRETTQAGWLLQAQQFYANALADRAILAKLSAYNLTEVQLAAGQNQIAVVAAGAVARQSSKGAAQESTRARDLAMQSLNQWMRDFLAIARIALADQL